MTTDINSAANRCTLETSRRNGVSHNFEAIQTIFAGGLLERMAGQADILVFNPPYVVTSSDEVVFNPEIITSLSDPATDRLIAASWAGGVAGREVVDRFWPTLDVSTHALLPLWMPKPLNSNSSQHLLIP